MFADPLRYVAALWLGLLYQKADKELVAIHYYLTSPRYDPSRREGVALACQLLFHHSQHKLVCEIAREFPSVKTDCLDSRPFFHFQLSQGTIEATALFSSLATKQT
jgi:hypothetical protein